MSFREGQAIFEDRRACGSGGRWSLNGIFTHMSGVPFTVTAAAGSCNCPGSQQIANQVLGNVATVGNGVNGTPYFRPEGVCTGNR